MILYKSFSFYRLLILGLVIGGFPILLMFLGKNDLIGWSTLILGLPLFLWSLKKSNVSPYFRIRNIILSTLWIVLYVAQFSNGIQTGISLITGIQFSFLSKLGWLSWPSQILGNILGDWGKVLILGPLFPIGIILIMIIMFWLPAIEVIVFDIIMQMFFYIFFVGNKKDCETTHNHHFK